MNPYATSRLYEANKKYIAYKITILDVALRALRDATRESFEKGLLKDSYYDLEDFRERQEQLIFNEVMNMDAFEVEKILEGTY